MANDKWINLGIRVSLITIAAIIIIVLITYYSKPTHNPSESLSSKGVEKFNSDDVNTVPNTKTMPTSTTTPTTTKSVSFNDPLVTSESIIPRFDEVTKSKGEVLDKPKFMKETLTEPIASDPYGMEDYIAVDYAPQQQINSDHFSFPQDKTKPEDLLPKDAANSKWAQIAPAGQGDLKNQNFLTAGYLLGKDTIGVAKKNPNLTLRAEPANPKTSVSPWMNSSIEPDQFRRGFEIGSSL